MRPITLTMSAFGPYAGKMPPLEFDRLGRSGLYLITGETGAGKTTIFDAIAFALFGSPSGDDRDAGMLRSKYAAPETKTEVELVFEYAGKRYTIRRNPTYYRSKARGEGFTKEGAAAELICPDGRVITKVDDVNRAVMEILGVDRNQFGQIAMLAQGEFRKLLQASTDERKKIFQKLFRTQKYFLLQNELSTKAGKLNKDYEGIQNSIRQYARGMVCSPDSILYPEVEEAKNGTEVRIDEVLELLDRLIGQDETQYAEITSRTEELSKELKNVDALLTKAEAHRKAETALKEANEGLLVEQPKLDTLIEELKKKTAREPEIAASEKRITKLEDEIPNYQKLAEQKALSTQLSGSIEKLTGSIREKQNSIEALTDELKRMREELDTLGSAETEEQKAIGSHKDLDRQLRAVGAIQTEIDAVGRLEKELSTAQEDFREKVQIAERLKNEHSAKENAYLAEQAGILAETLEEGKRCPVCGSESHPFPAGKSPEAPTKKELAQAKKAADNAQRQAADASAAARELVSKLGEKKAAAVRSAQDLVPVADYDELVIRLPAKKTELENEDRALKQALEQLEKQVERKKELDGLIPKTDQSIRKSEQEKAEQEKRLTADTERKDAADGRIRELKDKLSFASKELTRAEIDRLQTESKRLSNEIKTAQDNVTKLEDTIKDLNAKIKANEDILKDRVEINETEEQEKKARIEEEIKNLGGQSENVSNRLYTNKKARENIKGKAAEAAKTEKELKTVKALADTATGSLSGKDKIMLETFVQMMYFDRILARANTRLLAMTDGQYEFVRRKEPSDGRKQGGLDLDVIDHYNNSQRSANSLSGGEGFIASLALALGLSDEIQASAGGIRLDTLFVDEGFGSLDEDKLEIVMRALKSLTDGDRLVGIISHVSELKRIDKKIIVTKDRDGGSRACISIES